ncbi:MAG: 50S ribosomal protein L25/general stress protein Ctc [Alphaproteobacteria bacterium]|nr:50S ribosomal protein L25/general stress protein Ctc [Alphaproteobacteria bacterium SS10]
MSTEVRNLEAEARERVGKGTARAARRAGRIPAVIYGDKKEPVTITLSDHEIRMLLQKPGFMTTLWDIKVGKDTHRVLARDVQVDPVMDFPVHLDFLRVTAKTKIAIEVPVNFVNEDTSPGLKAGGTLNVVRYAVELLVSAGNIPESLEANVGEMELGDALKISDIDLPDGATPTITDRDFTIATVAAPSALKSEASEAEDGEEGEEGEATEAAADGAAEGDSEE